MSPSTKLRRALILASLGFVAGASSLSQTASRPSAPTQLQDAARELSAGRLDQAGQDLQSVLRSNPADERALDLLGVVRVLQHQDAKAEDLFQQVVKANPAFAPGHAHLGLLYLRLGRSQDARPELQQALRLDPGRADVVGALTHILQNQAKEESESGDLDGALRSLMEARKYAPDNADLQYEFGMVAHKLSLDDDAIEAFQQTLKLRKNDASAMYNLGFALMGRARFDAGDYGAAARDLHKSLDNKANDAGALTALGKVEFEQKHYPEALSLLQQAISQDDTLQEAHYYLGLTFARVGRNQESAGQLDIAARLEREQKERSRNMLRIRKPQDAGKQEPGSQQ
jgi:tetratricopeptide (TPR) repeat protein